MQIDKMTNEMTIGIVADMIAQYQKALEVAFEKAGVETTYTINGLVGNYAAVALDNAGLIPTVEVEDVSKTEASKVQA